MKLLDFYKIPYRETCENHFRMLQVEEGVTCSKHGYSCLSWDKSQKYWCCVKWGASNNLGIYKKCMGSSHTMYWFTVMDLMAATRKIFSALEMQGQSDYKCSQKIWERSTSFTP